MGRCEKTGGWASITRYFECGDTAIATLVPSPWRVWHVRIADSEGGFNEVCIRQDSLKEARELLTEMEEKGAKIQKEIHRADRGSSGESRS